MSASLGEGMTPFIRGSGLRGVSPYQGDRKVLKKCKSIFSFTVLFLLSNDLTQMQQECTTNRPKLTLREI